MPDISVLREQLKQLEEAVRLKLPEVATLISLTAKAFAERTIKDKGFGEVYSQTTVPAWFMDGKELNNAGAAFIAKKKKAKEKTNWGEFRAAQGLQVAHVDLSYTNTMWASMAPEEPHEEGGIIRAPLAGGNLETQNKMNWNYERYGDFIGEALTPENFQVMLQMIYDEIIRIIEDSGIILIKE